MPEMESALRARQEKPMNLWLSMRLSGSEEQTMKKMYWVSGALAGAGCTLMTLSVVGLALI